MIKTSVRYAHPTDARAFEAYYAGTHLSLAEAMTGVARLQLTRFLLGPTGNAPAFYRMFDAAPSVLTGAVERELGQGGMATVYLAEDLSRALGGGVSATAAH